MECNNVSYYLNNRSYDFFKMTQKNLLWGFLVFFIFPIASIGFFFLGISLEPRVEARGSFFMSGFAIALWLALVIGAIGGKHDTEA